MEKTIKLWLPVAASAEFEATIDIEENDSAKDIFYKFLESMEPCDSSLCWQCAQSLSTDTEYFDTDENDNMMIEEVEEMIGELKE